MSGPPSHPLRAALYQEIHARPSDPIAVPARISYLALLSPPAAAAEERRHLTRLAERFGVAGPAAANHYSATFGGFRLNWERHTEFARYTIALGDADPVRAPALAAVPADWLAAVPGELLAATHCRVLPGATDAEEVALARELFRDGAFLGTRIAGGAATFYSDFDLHQDGFGHMLLFVHSASPDQVGRMVQRLLELQTYWLLALLGLPQARDLAPELDASEAALRQIDRALSQRLDDQNVGRDAAVLDELIGLEAAINERAAQSRFRFGASRAYHELVLRRMRDLREVRIPGLQTLAEFTERRLAPAMRTCLTMEQRQQQLLEHADRSTQLLSTRVNVGAQMQNQAVLESLNKRTQLQLRLQQTVEGLSVAAITYYLVGLLIYVFRSLETAGLTIETDLAVGASVPIVALLVALGVRRIRRSVERAA